MNKTLYSEQQQLFLTHLKDVRQQAKLSQIELAARLGMQQSDISKCERGVRRLDVIELRSWLEALGLSFAIFAAELDARLTDVAKRNARSRPLRPMAGGT